MRGRELPALTPFSHYRPKLLREFEKVRSQGYAIEHEESALQATCIGVPILNREGRAVAALGVFPDRPIGFGQPRTIASPLPCSRLPVKSSRNFAPSECQVAKVRVTTS